MSISKTWLVLPTLSIALMTNASAETLAIDPNRTVIVPPMSASVIQLASSSAAAARHHRGPSQMHRGGSHRQHVGNPKHHHGLRHHGKSHTHKTYHTGSKQDFRHHSAKRYYRYPYLGYHNYGYQYYYPGFPRYRYEHGYRYRLAPYSLYNAPFHFRHRNFYYPDDYGLTRHYRGNYRHDGATSWVWSSHGKKPHGAIRGGRIHGQPYHICKADYQRQRHTGKLYGKGCHIHDGNRHVLLKRYQVLVER